MAEKQTFRPHWAAIAYWLEKKQIPKEMFRIEVGIEKTSLANWKKEKAVLIKYLARAVKSLGVKDGSWISHPLNSEMEGLLQGSATVSNPWISEKYRGTWAFAAVDVPVPKLLVYSHPKSLRARVTVTPRSEFEFTARGHTFGAISGNLEEVHRITIEACVTDRVPLVRSHYSIDVPERTMHATGICMLFDPYNGRDLDGYYVAMPTGQGDVPVAFGHMFVKRVSDSPITAANHSPTWTDDDERQLGANPNDFPKYVYGPDGQLANVPYRIDSAEGLVTPDSRVRSKTRNSLN
jgi:hypothetical protein